LGLTKGSREGEKRGKTGKEGSPTRDPFLLGSLSKKRRKKRATRGGGRDTPPCTPHSIV